MSLACIVAGVVGLAEEILDLGNEVCYGLLTVLVSVLEYLKVGVGDVLSYDVLKNRLSRDLGDLEIVYGEYVVGKLLVLKVYLSRGVVYTKAVGIYLSLLVKGSVLYLKRSALSVDLELDLNIGVLVLKGIVSVDLTVLAKNAGKLELLNGSVRVVLDGYLRANVSGKLVSVILVSLLSGSVSLELLCDILYDEVIGVSGQVNEIKGADLGYGLLARLNVLFTIDGVVALTVNLARTLCILLAGGEL
jgi:hypothetical protein